VTETVTSASVTVNASSNSVPACSTAFSHSSLASRIAVSDRSPVSWASVGSALGSANASVSACCSIRRPRPADRASGGSRIRRSS
jgi:hypothetical protein